MAFLNGLMNVLITENLYDKEIRGELHQDFDELKEKVMEYPPEKAAEICGVSAELIREIARMLATVKPVHALLHPGHHRAHLRHEQRACPSPTCRCCWATWAWSAAGVNPLRGQNNVQGACDMGALPNVFPGYQKVTIPAMPGEVREGLGRGRPARKAGLMMPQMMDGLPTARSRPSRSSARTWPTPSLTSRQVEHELASAEFIVCNDIFPTETTRFAHVIFPAAAWSEDDGTFTSSERG